MLFKGPVIITGGSSQLGMALARALREDGANTLSVCRSSEGLARCGEAGLSCLPLDEPESLPERCRGLLGEPPAHLVDLMHSRFESLIAGAAPEAIMEWAAVDIGLRARLVRAVGRSMLARRFGRCVFVSSSAAECPAEGQGYYAAAKLAGEALYRSLAVELSGRGVTACSLRLSWLDAGRGEGSGAGDVAQHALAAGLCEARARGAGGREAQRCGAGSADAGGGQAR